MNGPWSAQRLLLRFIAVFAGCGLITSAFITPLAFFFGSSPSRQSALLMTTSASRDVGDAPLVPGLVVNSSTAVNLKALFPKRPQQNIPKSDGRINASAVPLVPAQVVNSSTATKLKAHPTNSSVAVRSRSKKKRPKKKKQKVDEKATIASTSSESESKRRFPTTGNLPDLYWGSISMDDLRQHPNFRPLPESVNQLTSLADVSLFRQDSWQWDALHAGRLTTSQAAAALGFLEPTVGQMLGIPPSWRRGGRGAYHRLKERPLRTLEEMNAALCADGSDQQENGMDAVIAIDTRGPVWERNPLANATEAPMDDAEPFFVARYLQPVSDEERHLRREQVRKWGKHGDYLDRRARMIWGSIQEPTSLVTAINYFAKDGAILQEVGMCGADLNLNQTSKSGLLIGASPDGVLVYPDGSVEALEVKNHCPFFSNMGRKRHQGRVKRFSINGRPIENTGVMPQYVSQVQLEMLCLGPRCQSCIMIRQTANQGAMILRMQRNDQWINEMIYWLEKFQQEFVEQGVQPPRDFFWNQTSSSTEQSRYRRFVNHTAELRNSVKVVASIPNECIQRAGPDQGFFLD